MEKSGIHFIACQILTPTTDLAMRNMDAVEKGHLPSCDQETADSNVKPAAVEDTPVLEQNFSFFSACSLGLSSGNAWAVFGASIVTNSPLLRQCLNIV